MNIAYIDISLPNSISPGGDVLITSTNGTLYIKQSTLTNYVVGTITGGPLNGSAMTGTTGPGRFYFDVVQNALGTPPPVCPAPPTPGPQIMCHAYNNIALVKDFLPLPLTQIIPQVLQFSGNIAGVSLPTDLFNQLQYRVFDYSIYSPPDGMTRSSLILLCNVYRNNVFVDQVVVLSNNGVDTIFPYQISTSCRCLATGNRFYIISQASCV